MIPVKAFYRWRLRLVGCNFEWPLTFVPIVAAGVHLNADAPAPNAASDEETGFGSDDAHAVRGYPHTTNSIMMNSTNAGVWRQKSGAPWPALVVVACGYCASGHTVIPLASIISQTMQRFPRHLQA